MSVAVIGGGIIGLSIAWRLAQLGRQVTVFDKQAVGNEASWAGAGMLAPGGEVSEGADFGRLLLESRALYPDFVSALELESGTKIDYQESGGLDLAYSGSALDAALIRAAKQADLGIVSEPISAQRVHRLWPQVRTGQLSGALFYPRDAAVNPREMVAALKAACLARGVSVREWSAVEHIAVHSEAVVIETREQSPFESAVIAAGAWSSRLAVTGVPPLGVVEPVKGHLIGYWQPPQTCPSIVRHNGIYLLQRANGLLLAGTSMEQVGFDPQIQSAVVNLLAERAAYVLPCLADVAPDEAWIGFRPAAAEVRIGPWHSSRLFVAYGHFRNGILLAPLTAQRIAALIGKTAFG